MARLNITLNQEEILQLLLEDRRDAFKSILQASLNKILQAESSEQFKAEPYERSEERTDSRNGSRERELNTRIVRITLHVPRLKRPKRFSTSMILTGHHRSYLIGFVLIANKFVYMYRS
jgi:transposase-like protein